MTSAKHKHEETGLCQPLLHFLLSIHCFFIFRQYSFLECEFKIYFKPRWLESTLMWSHCRDSISPPPSINLLVRVLFLAPHMH